MSEETVATAKAKRTRTHYPLAERLARMSPDQFKKELAQHRANDAAFVVEIQRRVKEVQSLESRG